MKKIIVTKTQLNEYVEGKRANNIYYEIVEKLYENAKYLNEGVSCEKVNQSFILDYKRKGLISPKVYEMLIKSKIMNENYELL